MKPNDRYHWIREYMREQARDGNGNLYFDIYNQEFVDRYIEVTNGKYRLQFFGAFSCPQLGRDLSAMYRLGMIGRIRVSMGAGNVGMGFARWVWSYRL